MIDLSNYNESLTGATGIFYDGRKCDRCGNLVITLYRLDHKSGIVEDGILVCSSCMEDMRLKEMTNITLEMVANDTTGHSLALKWANRIREYLDNNLQGGMMYDVAVRHEMGGFAIVMSLYYQGHDWNVVVYPQFIEGHGDEKYSAAYLKHMVQTAVDKLARIVFLK